MPPQQGSLLPDREARLRALGFRFGINGPHAARTMMLAELRLLLRHTAIDAHPDEYRHAVVDANVLEKPTANARILTLRHLTALYGLDPTTPLFRALRRLWGASEEAQPMLALAVALARDPLLRASQPFVLAQHVGHVVPPVAMQQCLEQACPGRFSAASLRSFAQNVSGTWTVAGLLTGHHPKVRSRPPLYPESLTMLLFLGYLGGRTGHRLFRSEWTALVAETPEELERMAFSASHRGLLSFMSAGDVKDVRFPGYLTPHEEQLRQETLDGI